MVSLRKAGGFSGCTDSEASSDRTVSLPNYLLLRSLRFSIIRPRNFPNGDVTSIVSAQEIAPPPFERRLFDYCVLVDYDTLNMRPYVKSAFPPKAKRHEKIENLIIPTRDGVSTVAQEGPENRNFSLVLTDHTRRMYCFCRRVLPESSAVCLSLTYCLVTNHNAPKVFYKLLEYIEGKHGIGHTPERLIEKLYHLKMPPAGKKLSVTVSHPSQLLINMHVSRPLDTRLENTELCDVFRCLGPDGMVQVFEALLLERTVVLHSRHVSLLSACVQGLLLTLYPLEWKFILVTVVPSDMQGMLDVEPVVPMFAGTLQPLSEEVQHMDHICYVQLDEGTIRTNSTEQPLPKLPRALGKSLLRSLKDMERFKGTYEQAAIGIADAFVAFFAKLFIGLDTDTYQSEQFLEQIKTEDKKQFLQHLLKTEMFYDFVAAWHFSKTGGTASVESGGINYTVFNSKISELRERAANLW